VLIISRKDEENKKADEQQNKNKPARTWLIKHRRRHAYAMHYA
jgi:hypothetical protein